MLVACYGLFTVSFKGLYNMTTLCCLTVREIKTWDMEMGLIKEELTCLFHESS